MLTSIIAFIYANRRKLKEHYKDWNFHQNIHVQLTNDHSSSEDTQQVPCGPGLQYTGLQYNNIKNNIALLSGLEIAVVTGLCFLIVLVYIVHRWNNSNSENFYQQFLLKESIALFVYNILLPIGYLTKKKDLRKYIWEYIDDLIHG